MHDADEHAWKKLNVPGTSFTEHISSSLAFTLSMVSFVKMATVSSHVGLGATNNYSSSFQNSVTVHSHIKNSLRMLKIKQLNDLYFSYL